MLYLECILKLLFVFIYNEVMFVFFEKLSDVNCDIFKLVGICENDMFFYCSYCNFFGMYLKFLFIIYLFGNFRKCKFGMFIKFFVLNFCF